MITPSKADLDSPLSADIEQYLATDKSTAHDRVRLFRLASDLAISSFGNRQVLYERFYASDPLSRARALAAIYPKSEAMQRVLEFSEARRCVTMLRPAVWDKKYATLHKMLLQLLVCSCVRHPRRAAHFFERTRARNQISLAEICHPEDEVQACLTQRLGRSPCCRKSPRHSPC